MTPRALSRCKGCWSLPPTAGAVTVSHLATSLLLTDLSWRTVNDWSATAGGVADVAASANSLLPLFTLVVGATLLLLPLQPSVLLVEAATGSHDLDMFSRSSAKSIWLSLLWTHRASSSRILASRSSKSGAGGAGKLSLDDTLSPPPVLSQFADEISHCARALPPEGGSSCAVVTFIPQSSSHGGGRGGRTSYVRHTYTTRCLGFWVLQNMRRHL